MKDDNKSNDKKKNIFTKIAVAVAGFATTLLAVLCGRHLRNNRDRAEHTGAELDRAAESNHNATETVDSIKESVESAAGTVEDIRHINNECAEILDSVRKRGKKRKD